MTVARDAAELAGLGATARREPRQPSRGSDARADGRTRHGRHWRAACSAEMSDPSALRDPSGRLDVGALLFLSDAAPGIAIGSVLPSGRRIATLRLLVSTLDT
jgi:hypothetical protein